MIDMSRVNRALGVIEGIALGLPEEISAKLQDAVNILERQIVAGNCIGRKVGTREGMAAVPSKDALDELVEELHNHFESYKAGEAQDYSVVCAHCKVAADLIVTLCEELGRFIMERYAEGH